MTKKKRLTKPYHMDHIYTTLVQWVTLVSQCGHWHAFNFLDANKWIVLKKEKKKLAITFANSTSLYMYYIVLYVHLHYYACVSDDNHMLTIKPVSSTVDGRHRCTSVCSKDNSTQARKQVRHTSIKPMQDNDLRQLWEYFSLLAMRSRGSCSHIWLIFYFFM